MNKISRFSGITNILSAISITLTLYNTNLRNLICTVIILFLHFYLASLEIKAVREEWNKLSLEFYNEDNLKIYHSFANYSMLPNINEKYFVDRKLFKFYDRQDVNGLVKYLNKYYKGKYKIVAVNESLLNSIPVAPLFLLEKHNLYIKRMSNDFIEYETLDNSGNFLLTKEDIMYGKLDKKHIPGEIQFYYLALASYGYGRTFNVDKWGYKIE